MSFTSRIFKLVGAAIVAVGLGIPGFPPATTASGQTSAVDLRANRYLLIVENSRAMEKRLDGVTTTLQALLASGFNGQLQRGDSLGLWTYNEQLHTGQFPLQDLSPESSKNVSASITAFLTHQKFEKQPRFDSVWPGLGRIVTNSYLLTAIVVCTGTEDIHGTPFDDAINAQFAKWRTQQLTQRMPFVILLRGFRGQLTKYSVAAAPWPLVIPALPVETPVANVTQSKPAPARPAPGTLPSLIVSGKKSEPPLIATNSTGITTGSEKLTVTAPIGVAAAQIPAPQLAQTPPQLTPTSTSAGSVPSSAPSATVAQVSSVPSNVATNKNFTTAESTADASTNGATEGQQVANLRYSRLQTCATFARRPEVVRAAEYAAAGLLFLLGFTFLLVQRRKARRRASRPISLITRSLERH